MLYRAIAIRRFSTIWYGTRGWNIKEEIDSLSSKLYGKELALKVMESLKIKKTCALSHRDYCGWGFRYQPDSETNSKGHLVELVTNNDDYSFVRELSWDDEYSFVDWLAKQSDLSMSGADLDSKIGKILHKQDFSTNNQTITEIRLRTFIQEKE